MKENDFLNKNPSVEDFKKKDISIVKLEKGLNKQVIEFISRQKREANWMKDLRLSAFEFFQKTPMPDWGPDLSEIDFQKITYYASSMDKKSYNWDDIPKEIVETYDKLGILEAEQKYLAGVGAQYDSEVVYHKIKAELEKKGVIFSSPEEALKEHARIFKKYFNTVIPYVDNKFSALNSAVWSGGSFIYIPKNVKVEIPLQAYFRINMPSFGQFERTLIIADEGSSVHYVEGCTAPVYSKDSLHCAVVEIIALKNSYVKYSTIQNWSNNVYNLVTKRAVAYEGARVDWVDGNLGSKLTMKYPSVYLKGKNAHAEILSLAWAKHGQIQDSGGKVIHFASNTSSRINSKSISMDGGISNYRGLVSVRKGIKNIKSKVNCDAMLLDDASISNTYPYIDNLSNKIDIEHEASVSKISEEQLFYLKSKGFNENEASLMIVNGFLDPLIKELPMEYAIELNKLIEIEMEGSIG